MRKILLSGIMACALVQQGYAQQNELQQSFTDLKQEIIDTENDSSMLLSPVGFNVFLQRKALQYLTGTADLSLAKFYAAYSTDNDKLNLGFNFALNNRYTNRLRLILNPIVEADVKNNFSKLYEKGEWQNNIRGGVKLTWLPGNGTLNFWDAEADRYRKPEFSVLRAKKYTELLDKYTKEQQEFGATTKALNGKDVTTTQPERLKKWQIRQKEKELYEAVGIAEADYLEKERAYTWFQTTAVSVWGFTPLSKAEYYISPGLPVPFTKTNYKLWEVNGQVTHLLDWEKGGTLYSSAAIRHFQNNSANAALLSGVDLNYYNQYPNSGDSMTLALIGSDKAFTGDYKKFMTTTLTLQAVYFPPVQWKIKPGASVHFEKNMGDYDQVNWRYGFPIVIQGKEKPITIELQYRRNDVGNYADKKEHEVKKTVGISLGLPIVLLYK